MKKLYAYIQHILCVIHVNYNSSLVSKILINSLENKREGIKCHRLDGLSVSLREAKTQRTKGGNKSNKRIVIGLDDNGNLYLLDGRHLLEAYRILKKHIPTRIVHFISRDIKIVFTKTLKSLHS